MTTVLGIDAAWTDHEPSGVALVSGRPGAWQVDACAPSWESLVALAEGQAVDWSARPQASALPGAALVDAAQRLTGDAPAVVAVDMPLGIKPVVARRAADNTVSSRFGAARCATHSPMPDRPGPQSVAMVRQWKRQGVPLRTATDDAATLPALLEVYPHVALLTLCDASMRLPYKISRATRYWPGTTVRTRISRLLRIWKSIVAALESDLGELGLQLPRTRDVTSLASLKRYEDALDALVCAWMGTRFVEGTAEPLGDGGSAIWVPSDSASEDS